MKTSSLPTMPRQKLIEFALKQQTKMDNMHDENLSLRKQNRALQVKLNRIYKLTN